MDTALFVLPLEIKVTQKCNKKFQRKNAKSEAKHDAQNPARFSSLLWCVLENTSANVTCNIIMATSFMPLAAFNAMPIARLRANGMIDEAVKLIGENVSANSHQKCNEWLNDNDVSS